MKKIVKIVAIMAVLSTVFVGCKKPDDPVDPADSQPKAPTTETPGTTDGEGEKTPEVKDLVVFEGEEILEPSAADAADENYGNYVVFKTPVTAGSGYTKFEVTLSWDGDTAKQCVAQLMNDNDQASAAVTSTTKDSSTISGACFVGAKYQKWVDGKPQDTDCADGATKLQVFMQNSGYKATNGKITVTKIVLKK